MPSRIVYFANASIPSRTANSVHVMKMCEALGRRGAPVLLLVPKGAPAGVGEPDPHAFYGVEKTFSILKIEWFRWNPVGFRNIVLVLYCGLKLRLRFPGVLCITRNPLAGALFPAFGIRTILELHQPLQAGRPTSGLFRVLRVFRNPRLLKLVVISAALGRQCAESGCPPGKIQVLHDAVGEDFFRIPREETPARGVRSVGYVGGLYDGKGVEILVQLARLGGGYRYEVYGGSPGEVAHWRGKVPGVPDIAFHGHIPNARVPEALAHMDVVLMPYQKRVSVSGNTGDVAAWMSPLKMFEYMAAGKPIVSSDLGVIREVLEDGRNALLVDPEDAAAWLRAIDRLAGDPGLRARLGETARRDALKNHTWARRAEGILMRRPPDSSSFGAGVQETNRADLFFP